MKILLIEPDRPLAEIYAQALSKAGHTVTVAMGAQSGISAADHQTPDLVLLELQLAAHSGIEFLYEFRSYADWRAVPVLILSQVAPQEFLDNWPLLRDRLGVRAYLYKPATTLKELERAIDESLVLEAA
jgi:DNA-binding response OmpR family regulator